MTMEQLLKACGSGEFPCVKINKPVKYSKSVNGSVEIIKKTGCGVRFRGMKWNTWFWAEDKKDKRSRYMSQLTLINTN